MELTTPLVQPTETPSDGHAAAPAAPADNSPEREEFDHALSDDQNASAETDAAKSDQAEVEFASDNEFAEPLSTDPIEEIINRWSGVTGAFREKPPADLPQTISLPADTKTEEVDADEAEVALANAEIDATIVVNNGDNTDGKVNRPQDEGTPPELTEIQPESEPETPANQTVAGLNQPADDIIDDPSEPDAAVIEVNRRATRAANAPDTTTEDIAKASDIAEQQTDEQPPLDPRITASKPQVQPAANTSQDITMTQNARPVELAAQPREASAIHLAADNRVSPPPPPISRQIADAVITASDKMVEVRLDPAELGKIRMILTGQDRAPHLTIWVERPEILEQMRRHSGNLLQDLHDAGLTDATLDFRESRREQADADADNARRNRENGQVSAIAQNSLTQRLATMNYMSPAMLPDSRGIDIRV